MIVQYGKLEKHSLRKECGPAQTLDEPQKISMELIM
jgi:hypothetical protein